MKDVISCEKLRGAAHKLRSADIRMGQPGWSKTQSFPHEHIVRVKETRGTETSKYPQEEKETSILKVAASEMGRAQTGSNAGVVDHRKDLKCIVEDGWKAAPQEVKVPYTKCILAAVTPE